MNAKSRAALRAIGAVPAPGNIEYVEPEPEPAESAMPRPSAFDPGARQSTPPPSDPAADHAALLLAMAGPRIARRDALRGGWDLG